MFVFPESGWLIVGCIERGERASNGCSVVLAFANGLLTGAQKLSDLEPRKLPNRLRKLLSALRRLRTRRRQRRTPSTRRVSITAANIPPAMAAILGLFVAPEADAAAVPLEEPDEPLSAVIRGAGAELGVGVMTVAKVMAMVDPSNTE